ncbi:acidic fibroblast growth factor intracellular [Echinococcus multilocularis]|uniref:Acidic fibroblast growth factor intracellular n=1 Tax=Echinococcus multilocularis TaxID=6211 RepID=A0A068YG41_ECHMU|nr:acidic fibroblast growth factor intracellular [Echinococcus multilocularis]
MKKSILRGGLLAELSMSSTLVLLLLRCLLMCPIWAIAVQIKINTPTTTFSSIFEISSREKLGSGDLSPLLEGLYEEQEKYQDNMNPGELTISRAILVNMHHFLTKFMQPREALLWEMIMEPCVNDYERPQFVHMSWKLFWNSLREVNIQKDWNEWNPYWRPELPSPFTNMSEDVVLPDFEWDNRIFLRTANHTIRDWHTLAVFNLYFCEKPHLGHSYLCPDGCFGRRNLYDQHRELGNPCENATNTRTARCLPKPEAWQAILGRMWAQLENPEEALDGDFISGSFSWLTRNQGYECDCKEDHVWNQEDMSCEREEGRQKHCDPVTLKPCLRPGAKSCRMNDITGEAICTCHPQYLGNFCERLRDPCLERTINATLSDGTQLTLVSGQTMCQVNMDGMPTDPEYKEEEFVTPSKEGPSHVEAITLPLHSRCVAKLGTDEYFCQCERPFVEDVNLAASNCLLQVGSCDSKLCIHGACVTTANRRGVAVCMCYAGYAGPHCNQKWKSGVCGRHANRPADDFVLAEERGS